MQDLDAINQKHGQTKEPKQTRNPLEEFFVEVLCFNVAILENYV
jgi:hypothetical protein